MKYSPIIALLGLLTILSSSCSNELEIAAPWQDVTIINGLLSVTDTASYIRVERAFLDKKQSALNFTKNIDSIYYKDAIVSIIHDASGQQFDLTKVDGNMEGYVRDTGLWAQAPNYLYKIKTEDILFVPGDSYQIIINKGDNLPTTSARTHLVGKPKISLPKVTGKLSLTSTSHNTVQWQAPPSAKIYDVDLVFHYQESTPNALDDFHDKVAVWKPIQNLSKDPVNNYMFEAFDGRDFYIWLRDELSARDVKRRFVSVDVIVTAGGEEIKKYLDVSKANQGLTGSETSSSYSNIPNGLGIFSSTSKDVVAGLPFSLLALDSLQNGYLSAELQFVD